MRFEKLLNYSSFLSILVMEKLTKSLYVTTNNKKIIKKKSKLNSEYSYIKYDIKIIIVVTGKIKTNGIIDTRFDFVRLCKRNLEVIHLVENTPERYNVEVWLAPFHIIYKGQKA